MIRYMGRIDRRKEARPARPRNQTSSVARKQRKTAKPADVHTFLVGITTRLPQNARSVPSPDDVVPRFQLLRQFGRLIFWSLRRVTLYLLLE